MVSESADSQLLRDHPCFENSVEEAHYWKNTAQEYLQKLQDVRDEFEEFQEGSRELEAELETQLEQYESRVSDLMSTKSKLEDENSQLKERLETHERSSFEQITQLEDENATIKAVRDKMTTYIRELEQSNDDLERSKRATISSLESFDARLNNAIERNAFLENELEEKEQLVITVQRLKDESRDLRGELGAKSEQASTSLNESKLRLEETKSNSQLKQLENRKVNTPSKQQPPQQREEAAEADITTPTPQTTVNGAPPTTQNSGGSPMTPSARISALNIVSDLLRKVGALESKLASCRNFVQDHPPPGVKPVAVVNTVGVASGAGGINPLHDAPPPALINVASKSGSNASSGLVKVTV